MRCASSAGSSRSRGSSRPTKRRSGPFAARPCCGLPILPTEPITPTVPTERTPRRHAVLKMSYGDLAPMLVKETPFYHLTAGALTGPLNRHRWRETIGKAKQYVKDQAAHEAAEDATAGPPRMPVGEDVVKLVAPDDLPRVREFTKQADLALGIDLRKDLLGALGDKVVQYNSPSEGPLNLGQTFVTDVRVFNPSATVAGLSEYLWKLEQPAHAVANGYFVGAINRVGHEQPWDIGEFYGQSYFCNPRGQIIAEAPRDQDALVVADLNLDMIREVRNTWQFFRDRRPQSYEQLVAE